jgi:Ni,Fe-hydrogenase I small subunit
MIRRHVFILVFGSIFILLPLYDVVRPHIYFGAVMRTNGRNLEIFKRSDAVSDVGGRNGHKGTCTLST